MDPPVDSSPALFAGARSGAAPDLHKGRQGPREPLMELGHRPAADKAGDEGGEDHQGEAGRPPLQDFALISRIWNSDTGHPVVVIGGLYRYGTEAAGEFLNDRQLMQAIGKEVALQNPRSNIQIVLGTTVTDGTAGPPRILAVSSE